jgi:nicotinamide-nucleotide amidase
VASGDGEHVHQVATKARQQLLERVGSVVYAEGTTSMEEVVGELLAGRGLKIATAESCTGGLLAKRFTDVAGSSRYFERGFVTYSNESKLAELGVEAADLKAHGAVSAPVAEQLARGAREQAGVEIGVGITGVAGPEGGTPEKPVGTVFISVASPGGESVRRFRFTGSRAIVRERSAQAALDLVRRHVLGLPLDPTLDG